MKDKPLLKLLCDHLKDFDCVFRNATELSRAGTHQLFGAMLQQVKRLVLVETEEMYKARKQKVEQLKALQPPFVVTHLPAPISASVSASTS